MHLTLTLTEAEVTGASTTGFDGEEPYDEVSLKDGNCVRSVFTRNAEGVNEEVSIVIGCYSDLGEWCQRGVLVTGIASEVWERSGWNPGVSLGQG